MLFSILLDSDFWYSFFFFFLCGGGGGGGEQNMTAENFHIDYHCINGEDHKENW